MNGAKDFDQTIGKEGHRMPRNAVMLAQQLTNDGLTNVKAKWTITFTADAPDGSGRMTKSIVGSVDKLVPGNGPHSTGGNGQTSLAHAIANAGTGPGVTSPSVSVVKVPKTSPTALTSAFGDTDDD